MEPDVIITVQNWNSTSGYNLSASVRTNKLKSKPTLILIGTTSHWGDKIFDPPTQMVITDTKNCDYGKPMGKSPLMLCIRYCDENSLNYKIEVHPNHE